MICLILTTSGLNNDLKTRHSGDLQDNLSNFPSPTRARIILYELLRLSTLTLKDFLFVHNLKELNNKVLI